MIREFKGEFAWASNFWPARIVFGYEEYPTVEHAYQAAKTMRRDIREMIRTASTAGEAKRLGRAIPVDAFQPDWNLIKVDFMREFVHHKFCDPTLRRLLVATGDEPLQEGNTWGDEFWGVNLKTGKGLNMLGAILMIERAQIVRAS